MQILKLYGSDYFSDYNGVHFGKISKINATTCIHRHDFYEVFIVLKGSLVHEINNSEERLFERDLILVKPNDCHCYKSSGKSFEIVNLAFRKDILNSFIDFFDINFLNLKRRAELSSANLTEFSADCAEIDNFFISEPASCGKKIRSTIFRMLEHLMHFKKKQSNGDNNIPEWFMEFCEKISREKRFIKIKSLEKYAHCSQEHLCRSFRKYLNITPTEYINKLKTEYAAGQLLNSNESIFSIAWESGFNNLSYFYQNFKKRFGTSPAKFRQNKKRQIIP